MSKRGSRNALNFSGKSWSVGGKFSKSRLKKNKTDNKSKARDARRKAKFDLICEKFDFQIKNIENKQLYDKLLKQFIELKAMKGSRVAKRSVENVEYLRSTGLEFALLNCVSEYPPKFEDMQLKVISDFINKFPDIIIGHSDHTQTEFTSIIAVSLGARIVEKHLTISPLIHGPDRDVSLDPTQFQKLNSSLRLVNKVLGSEKVLHEKEKAVRVWAYRSVVAAQTIKMGEKVDYQNICTKRPGTGIPSKQYKTLIGKVANRQLEVGEMIMREDLL